METNKLLHFVTTYETQNLRQASEVLGMSHSALSKSLKTLEEEIGYRLFVPVGRGITHTERAKEIYQKAKSILTSVSELSEAVPANTLKKIKIATFEVFSTYFLQCLAEKVESHHIEMHENLQGDLEKSVSNGTCDFGITYEPIPFQGIEFLKITEIKMYPYVRSKSFVNVSTLEIPFAAPLKPVDGAPSGVKGLDGWPEHKFPRISKYQVDMMESAIELARQGRCAAFLPEFVVSLHNNIVQKKYMLEKRSFPTGMKTVKRVVYLVKRKNQEESSEMKKVCAALRSIK